MTFYQFLKKTRREAPGRFFTILFAASFVFWGGIIVLASPPDNPYAPGATLDPDCIPGSANCTVYPPLATGLTATTTVTMSDYPLNFDSGTFYIDSLNNRVGIGTASPGAKLEVAQTATATGALKGLIYTGAVNTNQTASTEIPSLTLTTAGREWATGALATQREVLITAPTYSFVGASAITDAATLAIAGAPIKSANASITNTHGLLIQAGAVSTATNSYGLTVNAQTGATNNYAAAFLGGNVGIGTSTPNNTIQVANLINFNNAKYSTFLGYQAGNVNTGNFNSFIGYQAGYSNTTGHDNSAIGMSALLLNTTGNYNSAMGNYALDANTIGSYNTAIGYFTLQRNTAGNYNSAMGYYALVFNTTGSGNTAIGSSSLYFNTTGHDNSAMGVQALHYNTTGYANSAIGLDSLQQNTTGYNNTAIGMDALLLNTTGGGNTALGYNAGDSLTTGSNNIIIGYDIDAPENAGSNQLSIGNLIFGTGINGADKTISTGNVGIGTTTPWRKLSVAGTAGFSGLTNDSTGYYLCLNTTTYEMATSTTACGASSLRFKENVQPMTYGLSEILQLNPVFYNWKDTYMPSENKRQIGLIAEEVSSIIPELAGYDSDGSPINVDYPKATAVIIKAIQELNEKIGNSSQYVSSQITGTFDGILDWLSDKVVRAKEFVADKITTKELCVEDVCVTRDQLKELLEKNGMGSGESSQPSVVSSQTELSEPVPEPVPEETPSVSLPTLGIEEVVF